MISSTHLMLNITLIGFITAWIGMFGGVILSYVTTKKGRRFQGTILGFTAGLMLAVICFDLLPEAFEVGNLYVGVLGIIMGLITATYIDGRLAVGSFPVNSSQKQRFLKTAIFLMVGMAIHNFPEGVALGSLLFVSIHKGIKLAVILALHCIPEGLAVAIPLKESGASGLKMFIISILISIPMGFGALAGSIISEISKNLVSICLGFAGGLMLYVTCGEILPESKEMWKGRLSTVGSVIGLTIGIVITSLFE